MSYFNLEGEDPSDAEIAELKAEIERLRATIADLTAVLRAVLGDCDLDCKNPNTDSVKKARAALARGTTP